MRELAFLLLPLIFPLVVPEPHYPHANVNTYWLGNAHGQEIPSWESCGEACRSNPNCDHWIYNQAEARCWLKSPRLSMGGNYTEQTSIYSGSHSGGQGSDDVTMDTMDIPNVGGMSTTKKTLIISGGLLAGSLFGYIALKYIGIIP